MGEQNGCEDSRVCCCVGLFVCQSTIELNACCSVIANVDSIVPPDGQKCSYP